MVKGLRWRREADGCGPRPPRGKRSRRCDQGRELPGSSTGTGGCLAGMRARPQGGPPAVSPQSSGWGSSSRQAPSAPRPCPTDPRPRAQKPYAASNWVAQFQTGALAYFRTGATTWWRRSEMQPGRRSEMQPPVSSRLSGFVVPAITLKPASERGSLRPRSGVSRVGRSRAQSRFSGGQLDGAPAGELASSWRGPPC